MTRIMAAIRYTALILSCALVAATAAAQSKGNARVNGKILDDQGKPAAGVLVRALKAGEPAPVEIRTNDKGEWKLENLAPGSWNLEFLKEGFDPQRMTVELTNRTAPINMNLTKAVDPNVELQAGMAKSVELHKAGQSDEARKIIIDLVAKYPEAYRLHAFVAQTFAEQKNYDKAIEHLKIVVDKEPADVDMKTFLAELYTMKGDKAEAQKILESIDVTQVKDPTVFINAAITSINAGKPEEAIATLDKLAKQFPAQANILYYRGRANIAAKKYPTPRPTSTSSWRRRRPTRVSCRMRKSFSNSSRTSSSSALAVACALAILTFACGGGSGGSDGGTPTPPPGGTTDVCGGTGEEADGVDFSRARTREDIDLAIRKSERADGNPRGRLLDALWLNRSRQDLDRAAAASATATSAIDIGEIAVVQDEGDLIVSPNAYDLRNLGLRFTRNQAGGYDVRRIDGGLRTTLGNRITLTDDDSVPLNVPFGFSFYGRTQTTAFVNSDGNVTFEQEDRASTERNVARLLTGPPRIAAFLADLDPSTGNGRVYGNAAASEYTVTWCGVRGFDSTRTTNAQLTPAA